MRSVSPSPIILRASSLKAFSKCPVQFRLKYREGLEPAVEATSLRFGTGMHEMFEEYARCVQEFRYGGEPDRTPQDKALEAIGTLLNDRYADIPATADPIEWETERNILLALFIGYQQHWASDPVEVTEAEREFELELGEGLIVQGTIDALGTWQGRQVVIERKTTSSPLDDSDYWGRLRNDVQVSMYVFYLAQQGLRIPTLYDVIRKPTIRRKQKETPQEFMERLVGDIGERPEHYFARREIARTDEDLDKFHVQLFRMADAIRAYDERNCWWPNYDACRAPYPCPFTPICHGSGAESVCDGATVPPGFKREVV